MLAILFTPLRSQQRPQVAIFSLQVASHSKELPHISGDQTGLSAAICQTAEHRMATRMVLEIQWTLTVAHLEWKVLREPVHMVTSIENELRRRICGFGTQSI